MFTLETVVISTVYLVMFFLVDWNVRIETFNDCRLGVRVSGDTVGLFI